MSVRHVTRRINGGAARKFYMVDIAYTYPDGRLERIRKVSPLQTRRGAEQYERALLQALVEGTYRSKEDIRAVPTLATFADEFIENYARANNKPSELSGKKTAFRLHLVPALGRLRLDEIGPREIEKFKGQKITEGYKPHTINNGSRCCAAPSRWQRSGDTSSTFRQSNG